MQGLDVIVVRSSVTTSKLTRNMYARMTRTLVFGHVNLVYLVKKEPKWCRIDDLILASSDHISQQKSSGVICTEGLGLIQQCKNPTFSTCQPACAKWTQGLKSLEHTCEDQVRRDTSPRGVEVAPQQFRKLL